jgi:hypothetical protein
MLLIGVDLLLIDLSAEILKLCEPTKCFVAAIWRLASPMAKSIVKMVLNKLFFGAVVLPMLMVCSFNACLSSFNELLQLVGFDKIPASVLSVAVLGLLLLSISTNVLGVIFMQFDIHLLMRDVSVEEMVPFKPLLSHRYLSEYGFKPWIRQWGMIWARVFSFCAKLLEWITIPVSFALAWKFGKLRRQ